MEKVQLMKRGIKNVLSEKAFLKDGLFEIFSSATITSSSFISGSTLYSFPRSHSRVNLASLSCSFLINQTGDSGILQQTSRKKALGMRIKIERYSTGTTIEINKPYRYPALIFKEFRLPSALRSLKFEPVTFILKVTSTDTLLDLSLREAHSLVLLPFLWRIQLCKVRRTGQERNRKQR